VGAPKSNTNNKGKNKFSVELIAELKKRRAEGDSIRTLAAKYGISASE
jgi:hypothetical protein